MAPKRRFGNVEKYVGKTFRFGRMKLTACPNSSTHVWWCSSLSRGLKSRSFWSRLCWCVYDVHKMHAWCVYDVHKMHACLMCVRCSQNTSGGMYAGKCMSDVCTICSQDACMPDVCTICSQDACIPDVCTMFTKHIRWHVCGKVHVWCVYDVHKMHAWHIMSCIRDGSQDACMSDVCMMFTRWMHAWCVCKMFTKTSCRVYGTVHKMRACLTWALQNRPTVWSGVLKAGSLVQFGCAHLLDIDSMSMTRCVSRDHTVMLSWWVHRVKERACQPC